MYKVIKTFLDLQDDFYKYNVGDTYPREGLHPSDERIAQLSGKANLQKEPLIKAEAKKARAKKAEG